MAKQSVSAPALRFGTWSEQGMRPSMEDCIVTCSQVLKEKLAPIENTEVSFFAIFDGHAGRQCATFCSEHILDLIIEELTSNSSLPLPHKNKSSNNTSKTHLAQELLKNVSNPVHCEKALKRAFLKTDELFYKSIENNNDSSSGKDTIQSSSGSACIAALIISTKLEQKQLPLTQQAEIQQQEEQQYNFEVIVANTGDSRCLLYEQGTTIALSKDHKPLVKKERTRIEEAGGFIARRRVNGHLALSRAFGDFNDKQNWEKGPEEQAVTVVPDVKREVVAKKQEKEEAKNKVQQEAKKEEEASKTQFLVLCCDGPFEVLDNEQVTRYIAKHWQGTSSEQITQTAKKFVVHCIEQGSYDNVSCIIVNF